MPTRACPTPARVPDSCGGWAETSWAGSSRPLAWGLLHFVAVSALPFCVGIAVQAVVDRSGTRLALAGGLMALLGVLTALGDTMLHRTAVTNWITAAARVQQLLARKTVQLGSALTRRVAAGEVVAVSTGDVEKIGWFVEAAVPLHRGRRSRSWWSASALVVYQPALGVVVAAAVPVLALAVLPLLPRADPAGRLPAGEGGPGHRTGLGHRRRPAGAARHRRRGTVPRPLPPRLPGGPRRRRAQRPHVVADLARSRCCCRACC